MYGSGYQFAQSKVTILPQRHTQKLITANRDEESGQIIWPDLSPKQPTCILCGVVGGREHRVFGQTVLAHDGCVTALQRKLNQPAKPVHKSYPTRVAKASTSGTTTDQDKADARLLVRALAQLVRGE